MSSCRPLSQAEEHALLSVVRKLPQRDRAVIIAQWVTGLRISEILKLTVGDVWRKGELLSQIVIRPSYSKKGYSRARLVLVLPELERALRSHLYHLNLKFEIGPNMLLFPSARMKSGGLQPLSRSGAHRIIKSAMLKAGVEDDGRLGTHTLRKTFARSIFKSSGNNSFVLRSALGHISESVSERYLDLDI